MFWNLETSIFRLILGKRSKPLPVSPRQLYCSCSILVCLFLRINNIQSMENGVSADLASSMVLILNCYEVSCPHHDLFGAPADSLRVRSGRILPSSIGDKMGRYTWNSLSSLHRIVLIWGLFSSTVIAQIEHRVRTEFIVLSVSSASTGISAL